MKTVQIVFSPTGGTQKVAATVTEQWSESSVRIDLSDPQADFSKCEIAADDRVVIAMPSFGGLAPAPAIERLKRISGNGAECTLICVYGNRAYEDTLVQMEDAARECGFRIVAAIAAIAQHSIIPQYATNRPDSEDEKQLKEFSLRIISSKGSAPTIPGNRPYKKAGGASLVPKPSRSCVKCGVCAKGCPLKAIDTVKFTADPKLCIGCMRCVKDCPHNARTVSSAMVSIAAMAIKKACSVRKDNELFI